MIYSCCSSQALDDNNEVLLGVIMCMLVCANSYIVYTHTSLRFLLYRKHLQIACVKITVWVVHTYMCYTVIRYDFESYDMKTLSDNVTCILYVSS